MEEAFPEAIADTDALQREQREQARRIRTSVWPRGEEFLDPELDSLRSALSGVEFQLEEVRRQAQHGPRHKFRETSEILGKGLVADLVAQNAHIAERMASKGKGILGLDRGFFSSKGD